MTKKTQKSLPYRAASIQPAVLDACEAVRQIVDQRFLAHEVPMLPLYDCSNPAACRCKYTHWNDRRQDDRRTLFSGIGDQYFAANDKRTGKDRRSTD